MQILKRYSRTFATWLFVAVFTLISVAQPSSYVDALPAEQKKVYDSGVGYFDIEAKCDVSGNTTPTTGGNIYMLGDSITNGADDKYRAAFTGKGISAFINASGGRSWTGGGMEDATTDEGSTKPGREAIQDDRAKISAANGIVIALGSNGGLSKHPIDEIIDAFRAINESAPIWWVDTAGTSAYENGSLTFLGPFNRELEAKSTSREEGFSVIKWSSVVNPGGDPGSMPTTDPNRFLSDGLHPTNAGKDALVNLVTGAVQVSAGGLLAGANKAGAFSGPLITPTAVVLHWTAGQYDNDPQGVVDTLRNREGGGRQVQLYIDDTGRVHQLTEALETKPIQTMNDDPTWNDVSIGIEIESINSADINANEEALLNNAAQYASVIGVVKELVAKYGIAVPHDLASKRGVFGHYEANAGNSDPGTRFMEKIRADLAGTNPATPTAPPTQPTTGGSGCTCGGGGGGPASQTSGTDNRAEVWNYFADKGLTPPQIAGIMGNLQAESGFNPIAKYPSTTSPTPPGNAAWGLAQWTDGRQTNLVNFARSQGKDPATLRVQLDFLWNELETNVRGNTLEKIRATNDIKEATRIFLVQFETPCNSQTSPECLRVFEKQLDEHRLPFAQTILTELGSGTSTAGVSSGVGGCGAVALDASGCPQSGVPRDQTVSAEGINVHPCIAAEVTRIMQLARSQGLDLGGGGWRSPEDQIRLRQARCPGRVYDPGCKGNPPTAVPGRSRHERGTAIDFSCNGRIFSSRSSPCFIFLQNNTSLKNLPSEAWHWSIDGS